MEREDEKEKRGKEEEVEENKTMFGQTGGQTDNNEPPNVLAGLKATSA